MLPRVLPPHTHPDFQYGVTNMVSQLDVVISVMMTKVSIEYFKTFIIFRFYAHGGYLFGTCAMMCVHKPEGSFMKSVLFYLSGGSWNQIQVTRHSRARFFSL